MNLLHFWRSRQDPVQSEVCRWPRQQGPLQKNLCLTIIYERDMASEFELWLEDVNDYMAICKVTEAGEKKSLFLNLAGLSLRRIVKGLVVPTPSARPDGEPGDTCKALADAVLGQCSPPSGPYAGFWRGCSSKLLKGGTVIKMPRTQDHISSQRAVFRIITLKGSTSNTHVGA